MVSTQYKKLLIWGADGHCKVLEEFIDQLGYKLVSVFDNDTTKLSPFPEIPIYFGYEGLKAWLEENNNDSYYSLVAIGGTNGKVRVEILEYLSSKAIAPIVVIHPTAFVARSAIIGEGCQVLANSSVSVNVKMGVSCIINTSASVDHECELGDGVHVAPGAILDGCVTVDNYSFIGSGAVVLPRIHVGKNVIVGAGSIVTKDIPDGKVVYGNPAKIIRDNTQ